MYGKKVKALIWNDETFQSKDIRRTFQPVYIFDYGFDTLEEAKQAVTEEDYEEDCFRYVCFCKQWYPAHLHSFYEGMVISRNRIRHYEEAFGNWVTIPRHKNLKPEILDFFAGSNAWQKGIYEDLSIIDESVCVYASEGASISDVETNNTLITFGIPHFSTEICIRTNSYTEHVFQHYYSDKSMEYEMKKVKELRSMGVEYYNPFSKETSINEKEKNRKNRSMLKNVDMDKTVYDNRRISALNGRRIMTPEDVEAARRRFIVIK